MSHGKLRKEKNCLNCGHYVEERYCPHCGQENIETRQPFHYLFTHFVEDFTHYDGQFWGTLKNLLFKPGKLTNIYLEGKRQQFVPPVKLYIFVSFIVFFLFALFPPFHINFDKDKESKTENTIKKDQIAGAGKMLDSITTNEELRPQDKVMLNKASSILKDSAKVNSFQSTFDMDKTLDKDIKVNGYDNRKSYDSAMVKNPKRFDFINRPFAHKMFELQENGIKKGDIAKNLFETSFHNLPKALFIYLPIFAFFLWIFHNKKKWWYFDHGIFTLHYFSFLLLNILIFSFLNKINNVINIGAINWLLYLAMTGIIIYSALYFFIAHRRVYHSHGIVSLFIGFILFSINFVAFLFLVVGLGLISFLMIH